jgi:hypothetical protein
LYAVLQAFAVNSKVKVEKRFNYIDSATSRRMTIAVGAEAKSQGADN